MTCADIRRTGVDIFAIYLIREEIEVVFLHEVTDLVHLATSVEITSGVVGIAYHDGAGAVVDKFLKLLHLRQRESLLDCCGNRAYLRSCRYGKCHIVGVCWFWYDNLVAGIEARHKCEEHSLTSARRDNDVVGVDVDVILLIIVNEFFSITQISLRGRVFENLTVDVLECIQTLLWRGQVGLSDIEVIYLGATLLCCSGKRCEFSDRRLGHLMSAN